MLFVIAKACSAYFSEVSPPSISSMYCNAITYAGWTILLWTMLLRDRSWVPPIPKRARLWVAEILLGILMFGVVYLFEVGLIGFLKWSGFSTWHERKEFKDFLLSSGSLGLFSHSFRAVFSSLFEEVFFRTYLLHRLGKYFASGFWPLVLSAFSFSIVHGYHFIGAIQMLFVGLLFGIIYQMSPQLPKLWVAHWLLDII